MSDLVLRLAEDATVRGLTIRDGMQVFSVYDSMALFCGKSESYARTTWSRLILRYPKIQHTKRNLKRQFMLLHFVAAKKAVLMRHQL